MGNFMLFLHRIFVEHFQGRSRSLRHEALERQGMKTARAVMNQHGWTSVS